jgi:putative addiction module component (TIGR02574 family)
MSANARELGLDKLPTEDKVALINELWADVVAEERSHPIPAELAKLLDERVAEYEANPDQLHTIEQVVETLRADRKA